MTAPTAKELFRATMTRASAAPDAPPGPIIYASTCTKTGALAFWAPGIGTPPADAITITVEQWRDALENQGMYRIKGGKLVT